MWVLILDYLTFTILAIMAEVRQVVHSELHLTMGVHPRHLPHHTRFVSHTAFTSTGPARVFNPVSLASLCSTLLVANSEPDLVKR
jgi:hypothetical protein